MDISAIRQEVERQVLAFFQTDPAVLDSGNDIKGTEVIGCMEYSLLNPDTTLEKIKTECAVARKYAVAAVCVAPYYVPYAVEILNGSVVRVSTAVGFPHGCMSQAAKIAELKEAINNGATEIDLAMNNLAIKSGHLDVARRELEEAARLCLGKAKLKAVFEHGIFTEDEKYAVLDMLPRAGIEALKIQNMLSGHGARVEDVRLVRQRLGRNMRIKIDGGIKTLEQAEALLHAGADRLGLTATAKIAEEALSARG